MNEDNASAARLPEAEWPSMAITGTAVIAAFKIQTSMTDRKNRKLIPPQHICSCKKERPRVRKRVPASAHDVLRPFSLPPPWENHHLGVRRLLNYMAIYSKCPNKAMSDHRTTTVLSV
jgi:hypothetical protein